jgi:hypothetical protein
VVDYKPEDRVLYVPGHVARIPSWEHANHPDCEWGTVSSVNEHTVFVRFDAQVSKFGWGGTTAQGCSRNSLLNATRKGETS